MTTSIKRTLVPLCIFIGSLIISCNVNTSSEAISPKKQLKTHSIYGANIQLRIGASEAYDAVCIIDSTQDDTIKKKAIINYMCKIVILEEKGDWIKVQVVEPQYLKDNYIGWIPRKHLDDPSPKTQNQELINKYKRNPVTNQECFAASSMSTFNDLNKVANKKESDALLKMIMNGEVIVLPKATEIKISERSVGTVIGIVQSGKFSGYKVVVSSEFISY